MPTTNVINLKDIPEPKIVKLVDLSEDSINKIAEAVVRKIAVDDLEVVQCKDCVHWFKGICSAHTDNIYMDENDFCSLGGKK